MQDRHEQELDALQRRQLQELRQEQRNKQLQPPPPPPRREPVKPSRSHEALLRDRKALHEKQAGVKWSGQRIPGTHMIRRYCDFCGQPMRAYETSSEMMCCTDCEPPHCDSLILGRRHGYDPTYVDLRYHGS